MSPTFNPKENERKDKMIMKSMKKSSRNQNCENLSLQKKTTWSHVAKKKKLSITIFLFTPHLANLTSFSSHVCLLSYIQPKYGMPQSNFAMRRICFDFVWLENYRAISGLIFIHPDDDRLHAFLYFLFAFFFNHDTP